MALPIRLILGLVASFQTVSAHRLLLTSLTDSEVKTSKQGKHWSPKPPLRGRVSGCGLQAGMSMHSAGQLSYLRSHSS